jgi:hypothetical protein
MDPSTFQAHVAYSAGMPKTKGVVTGAGAIVELLKVAGPIQEEDGKLVAATHETPTSPSTLSAALGESVGVSDRPSIRVGQRVSRVSPPRTPPSVSIQLQIQCAPADLEVLAPRLRELLRELSTAEDDPTAN